MEQSDRQADMVRARTREILWGVVYIQYSSTLIMFFPYLHKVVTAVVLLVY